MLELCVLNTSLPFSSLRLSDETPISMVDSGSPVWLSLPRAQSLDLEIKSGEMKATGSLLGMNNEWISHERSLNSSDGEVKVTLGMKLHLARTEELDEAREQLRISEASRVTLMSELNELMHSLQLEIQKLQLRQDTRDSSLENTYKELSHKYRASLDEFRKKEEYLIGKVREIGRQKTEAENNMKKIREELDDVLCELNYYKGVLDIETNKNQAEKNCELEKLLENSSKLLEAQSIVNKNSVDQMKILQNRNLQLVHRMQELENKKTREMNEESYRFSFGSPYSLEEYQDEVKALASEILKSKGINSKVKILASGEFQIGKKTVTLSIENGVIICKDKERTVNFDEFVDKHSKSKKDKMNKSLECRRSQSKTPRSVDSLAQKAGMRVKNLHFSRDFSPILNK